MLRELGMRHINYGLVEVYYEKAGEALLFTLRQFLGSSFTPDVEQAWKTTYGFISAVILGGLHEAQDLAERASVGSSQSTVLASEMGVVKPSTHRPVGSCAAAYDEDSSPCMVDLKTVS